MIGKIDNPRADFNKSIDEFQKEFLTDDFRDYYGEVYTGKVINNKDPLKLGRCQIRVYSVYEDTIPDSDLPWAIPNMEFVGSKIGSFIVPPVDTIVTVIFDKGDIYIPRYTTKTVDKATPSKLSSTDYPNTMVFFETDEGDSFTLNRKDGKSNFTHRSGSIVTIDKDNIKLTHASGSTITMAPSGEVTIEAKTINVKGKTVNMPSTNVGTMPNPGPFCMLPACLFTGATHTDKTFTNP